MSPLKNEGRRGAGADQRVRAASFVALSGTFARGGGPDGSCRVRPILTGVLRAEEKCAPVRVCARGRRSQITGSLSLVVVLVTRR